MFLSKEQHQEWEKQIRLESEKIAGEMVASEFQKRISDAAKKISADVTCRVCNKVEQSCQEEMQRQIGEILKGTRGKGAAQKTELYMQEAAFDRLDICVETIQEEQVTQTPDIKMKQLALTEEQKEHGRKIAEAKVLAVLSEGNYGKSVTLLTEDIYCVLIEQEGEPTTFVLSEQAKNELELLVLTRSSEAMKEASDAVECEFNPISQELVREALEPLRRQIESAEVERKQSVEETKAHACAYGKGFYVRLCEDKLLFGGRDRYAVQKEIATWKDIVSVVTGDFHVVGLDAHGKVYAAGKNDMGQCETKGWCNIVQITACGAHTAALDKSGRVFVCGDNDENLKEAENWTGITKISLGYHHILGLCKDGTVKVLGYNDDEQCTDVSKWRNVTDISAGCYHSLGLLADGTVAASGINLEGECDVERWKNMKAICAGNGVSSGVVGDGSCVFAGKADFEKDIQPYLKTAQVLEVRLSKTGENRCYIIYQ